jgi:mannan endo-1,4-beta-mannosidase
VYAFAVYARDAAGNRSTRSGTVGVTTPSGPTGGCSAVYRIVNQWPGGFQAEVTVTNGALASAGWTVGWTYANGQTVTQIWNGQDTPSGATHTVRNVGHNGNLGPNASTAFGFLGTWNGTNSAPAATCTRLT